MWEIKNPSCYSIKYRCFSVISLILMFLTFSGCSAAKTTVGDITIIYFITAIISLLIAFSYFFTILKENRWFLLLFSSVFVVNLGYFFGSVSKNLEQALHANRISYLGSVFLPFSMLMIILKITHINYKKLLPLSLFILSIVIFLIAATPGILPIYYKEVSFEVINGASILKKVYGPLHPLYLVYLLGYFASMIYVIFYGIKKKIIKNISHAVIMLIAVFINLCVWSIEQFVNIDFELLSISYIISEVFLLGLSYVIYENEKLKILLENKRITDETALKKEEISKDELDEFIASKNSLTKTELKIFDLYTKGLKSKEVMEALNITENTLKFHNKHIYCKFGVSSRKELIALNERLS